MNQTYTFTPRGVCSREMKIILDEDDKIVEFSVVGGCQGNLAGLSRLLTGMDARTVAAKLQGVDCRGRGTSCPDQLAQGLQKIFADREAATLK